ncbi:MAG TPA: site-specific integrase [Actinomycetota bacterium]
MDRSPTRYLGITKRTWRNRAGGLEVRYDVRIRGTGGKRVARTFTRLGHAKAWLDEQRTAKRRGDWNDPFRGAERLDAYFARWRARAASRGRPSERTQVEYDRTWRLWISPAIGARPLSSITRDDVEAVVDAAGERSAWRAHDTLKLLRRILWSAVADGLLLRNPAPGVELPEISGDGPWVLEPAEFDRLLAALPDRYRALVLVGAYGALRWSELVALRAERFDIDRDRIRVSETLVESGRMFAGRPKTRGSRRWVTLPGFVVAELAEHLYRFPPAADGLIFTAPEGGPIRRPHFGRIWRRATAAAGLDGFQVRNLRHTGATWALQAGVNPVLVAFRLGHTSTRMIEAHYAHLLESMDREIADRLEASRGT